MTELFLAVAATQVEVVYRHRRRQMLPAADDGGAGRVLMALLLLAFIVSAAILWAHAPVHSHSVNEASMLTLPTIVEHRAMPYVAIRRAVTLPFDAEIPDILGTLFATMARHGVAPSGPLFFKHNRIAMPEIEMEFGAPVAELPSTSGDLIAGHLPAGRYAEITSIGPYDDLFEVNGVLIGWARHKGLDFDSRVDGADEWFANRLEIYHNSPDEEPDPQKLRTTVAIKLRD